MKLFLFHNLTILLYYTWKPDFFYTHLKKPEPVSHFPTKFHTDPNLTRGVEIFVNHDSIKGSGPDVVLHGAGENGARPTQLSIPQINLRTDYRREI